MRFRWTAFVSCASVLLIHPSAFADQHGRGAGAATHAQATSTGAKPTPGSAAKPTGAGAAKHGTTTTTTSTANGTKSGSASTTTAAVPPNPIASKIASKPQLNARITAMLPKGMTLNQASSGFKNQGQFIAALHVSQNLGIPFTALKKDMTVKQLSLGQSIQDLRPTAHSEDEARKAQLAADHDLDDTKK